MYHHLLFDLDGTLTDPREGILKSIQYALVELGYPPPPEEELLWCIGPPLRYSFPILLGENDPRLVEEAVRLYRVRYEDVGLFENEVYDSAHILLDTVRLRGHPIFLCTGKPIIVARRVLEHFNLMDFFHHTYGNEPSGQFDDKQNLVAHIVGEHKLPSNQSVIIGDRKHDILAGRAHGLGTIGVTWGYGSREELEEHKAHHIVDTTAEILALLEQPGKSSV